MPKPPTKEQLDRFCDSCELKPYVRTADDFERLVLIRRVLAGSAIAASQDGAADVDLTYARMSFHDLLPEEKDPFKKCLEKILFRKCPLSPILDPRLSQKIE